MLPLNRLIKLFPSLFWKYRHIIDPNWADNYISEAAIWSPHRALILQALDEFAPFWSLMEVGCASGANLARIHISYPDVPLYGKDISLPAIRAGRKYFSKNPRITLVDGDIRDERVGRYDVILTDAVLIYVKPKEINQVIYNLWKQAAMGLILCEWHDGNGSLNWHGNYVHNYRELLPTCDLRKITYQDWPDEGWAKYGHIITVHK